MIMCLNILRLIMHERYVERNPMLVGSLHRRRNKERSIKPIDGAATVEWSLNKRSAGIIRPIQGTTCIFLFFLCRILITWGIFSRRRAYSLVLRICCFQLLQLINKSLWEEKIKTPKRSLHYRTTYQYIYIYFFIIIIFLGDE